MMYARIWVKLEIIVPVIKNQRFFFFPFFILASENL